MTVEDYRRSLPRCSKGYDEDEEYEDAEVRVPLKTTISQIKAMGLLQRGGQGFKADKFTLEHEGVELGDECTLGSIYSPGSKELRLKVHSLSFTVREGNNKWNFPLNMKRRDLVERGSDFVKEQVHLQKGIHPRRVQGVEGG